MKELFPQIALTAAHARLSPLTTLAFDGTKVRADNHRFEVKSPEQLEAELDRRLLELEELARQEDLAADRQAEFEQERKETQAR